MWHATAGCLSKLMSSLETCGREWPLAGVPDTTFFNLKSGLVHVASENPGLV